MVIQRRQQEARGRSAGQGNSMPRIIAGGLKNKAQRSTAKMIDAHNEKVSNLNEAIRETRNQIQLYQPLKINIKSSTLHAGKVLIDAEKNKF